MYGWTNNQNTFTRLLICLLCCTAGLALNQAPTADVRLLPTGAGEVYYTIRSTARGNKVGGTLRYILC
jgi:hypothetical protein